MKRAKITKEIAFGNALNRFTSNVKQVETPKEVEPTEQGDITKIKLSVFLNRKEDTYLESLASTAKFSGGKKISKTRLIEAMVRAFSTTKLDVRGVKTDEELIKRVIAQLR